MGTKFCQIATFLFIAIYFAAHEENHIDWMDFNCDVFRSRVRLHCA